MVRLKPDTTYEISTVVRLKPDTTYRRRVGRDVCHDGHAFDRSGACTPLGFGCECPLVLPRHDFDNAALQHRPILEQPSREPAAGVGHVLHQHHMHEADVLGIVQRFEIDHFEVASALEPAVAVDDVCDAAAHAGREVAPG